MLLHEPFETTARHQAHKVALVAGAARHTYGALATRADALAATLARHGVVRGDRVLLATRNSTEMVIAIYATLKVGAIFSPVGPNLKAAKLGYILNDCRPTCVIVDGGTASCELAKVDSLAGVRLLVVVGAIGTRAPQAGATLAFSEAVADAAADFRRPASIDQDLAAIIYTSGSTGDPKGVMLSHLNMLSAANAVTSYLGLASSDSIFCALPLSFDYGLYQILMAFQIGARVVLEPSFAFPVQALEVMEREGVTVFPGVPTMFALLMALENLGDFRLERLRIMTNTAAALPLAHIEAIRQQFPQARLFSMYGLTECKRVSYLPPEALAHRPGSVGRGMPNQEVYLIDAHGRRLPPGSTGELVVRGSNVMRGYWGKARESAECLRPGPYPGESVLHTGDIFRMDEEGYLYFVGRKDDMIKSRGEKVSPREIENVLHDIDGVLEAAVIGVPDPVLGEAIQAYLILKPGARQRPGDILSICRSRLEPFMVPRAVAIVDALPKSENGKVDKKVLGQSAMDGASVLAAGHLGEG